MRLLRTTAATAVLALALGTPALAQRGPQGGDRGRDGRGDGGSGHHQPRGGDADRGSPRGNASIADRLNLGAPPATLPGLGSASLITPRPGVDAFRANPGTYGDRSWGSSIAPRGPSWGGVPVSSVPSWSGTPIYESEHRKRSEDRDYREGRRGSRRQYRGGYTGGYAAIYGMPYGYMPYGVAQPVVAGQPASATPAQAEVPEGFLRLLVTPRSADVFVDGVLAGSVDDFGGTREQALPAGPHRIRIEAPGYEPVEFDVRVPAGDTISLRRELSPLPAPPRAAQPASPERSTPSAAPAGGKTFYAIPRCYLGNTVPRAESLPPGCSLKDLRVLPQE